MIVIDPDFTPQPMQGAYILQSTGLDKIHDVEDNQQKFGVQLDSLEQALKEAKRNNHVYLRTVQCLRNAEFKKHLAYAHSVVHNRPYDDNPIDWIKSLFDDDKGKVHKKTTFFCSALVSYLLASLGIIGADTDWTIVRPKDLGSEPGHRFIQWLSPVKKEIKIF
jgi:nicotinamide mononucleotide adenylyltransferase